MPTPPSAVTTTFWAGAATSVVTPPSSVFLFGYPHVPRASTGIHDQLETSALFLRHHDEKVIFISNDLIFVGRQLAQEVRRRVSIKTGVPMGAIAITATHTHSGPVMLDYLSNSADPVVPKTDLNYVKSVADSMVEAACAAVRLAVPAEAGLAVARAEGVGTNRHDPAGPADPDVPVLMVRTASDHRPLACMVSYAMHPTVLHEDSTLISGDFPYFTREYLRTQGLVPKHATILYHNGASGNQSPRHVTRENTFKEAQRLGEILGAAIARVIPGITYSQALPLKVRSTLVDLQLRALPTVAVAELRAQEVKARFDGLRAAGAPRTAVRTAECDWFGAEEAVSLARAKVDGRLEVAAARSNPAEIQVIQLGEWNFIFWPGEFFVEYALEIKARWPKTFVVTMANGELQGYIVTPAAAALGGYEATNALFGAENGDRFVKATLALLADKS